MRTILLPFLALLLPSLSLAAPCPTPVDASRVTLFIDMNTSYKEVAGARAAACKIGTRFVSIPEEKVSIEVGKKLERALLACEAGSLQCDSLRDQAKEAARAYAFNIDYSLGIISERLRAEKAHVSALIVSGHHAGGGFYGDDITRGTFEDEKFVEWMKTETFQKTEFLALWGCGAVNAAEAAKWKLTLPALKTLAGYSHSAPRGFRQISADYLEDVLRISPFLPDVYTESKMEELLRQIRGGAHSSAAIYVRTAQKQDYLYEAAASPSGRAREITDLVRCYAFKTRLPDDMRTVRSYDQGELPIPPASSSSPLSTLSADIRANQDCLASISLEEPDYTLEEIEHLRTFESDGKTRFIQKNAAAIRQADAEWQRFNSAQLLALLRAGKSPGMNSHEWNERVQDYVFRVEKIHRDIGKTGLEAFLKHSPRAEILRVSDALHGAFLDPQSALVFTRLSPLKFQSFQSITRLIETDLIRSKQHRPH